MRLHNVLYEVRNFPTLQGHRSVLFNWTDVGVFPVTGIAKSTCGWYDKTVLKLLTSVSSRDVLGNKGGEGRIFAKRFI